MEYIMSIVISLVIFFLFKTLFLGRRPSTRSVVIYSAIYAVIYILPSISTLSNYEGDITYLLVNLITNALLVVGTIVFYVINNNPRIKHRYGKKYRDNNYFTLKLIRIVSLIILSLSLVFFVLTLTILKNELDKLYLSSLILLIVLLLWNIIINIFIISFKLKNEKVIVINNRGYEIFETNGKYLYKLSDLIDINNIYIEKTVRALYTSKNGDNSYMKVYFIPKFKLDEDIEYNHIILNQLNNTNKGFIKIIDN